MYTCFQRLGPNRYRIFFLDASQKNLANRTPRTKFDPNFRKKERKKNSVRIVQFKQFRFKWFIIISNKTYFVSMIQHNDALESVS
jgi:hypothetical protein